MPQHPRYTADFSLALINRTGAFHICNDLLRELPQYFADVRYWRLPFQPQPTLLRKVAGRAMLMELRTLGDSSVLARSAPENPVLFMDPLYVLRTELRKEDIVICHDVGPITHPDLFEPETVRTYHIAYDKIAKVNPGIVTVSDFSLNEYQKLYGAGSRFIVVARQYVRLGIAKETTAPVEGVNKPFLLTIGALEKRKNHLRVIEAYRRSGLFEQGVNYVYGGARTPHAAEVMEAARATPGVIPLDYVSEDQLRWLFRNAAGFVLPSLLEGFGLPPLEAAQEGLVSVVSANTVQPESTGGNAIIVDPYDPDAIAEGMKRLVAMSPEEKADIVAKARAHASSLSYERYIRGFEKILAANDKPAEPI